MSFTSVLVDRASFRKNSEIRLSFDCQLLNFKIDHSAADERTWRIVRQSKYYSPAIVRERISALEKASDLIDVFH